MLHSRAIVGVDALSPVIDALLGRQTENPAVSGIGVRELAHCVGVVDGDRRALDQSTGQRRIVGWRRRSGLHSREQLKLGDP